jgi:hypothetical protein
MGEGKMILRLKRDTLADACTLGRLYQALPDGSDEYLCETLEDKVREIDGKPVHEWKVYGQTAIPRGAYKVIIDHSPRFGRDLPRLLQVPGFDGVRIHPGNTARDTEGCILVGVGRGPNSISQSRAAFALVMDRIAAARGLGERVTIEIT